MAKKFGPKIQFESVIGTVCLRPPSILFYGMLVAYEEGMVVASPLFITGVVFILPILY
jgi:hypothetical protein